MASSKVTESHRENAEIYYGENVCKQKYFELSDEFCLPKGLMPVEIVELGFDRSSGFVWMKLEGKKEHQFKGINKVASYDTEITFIVEKYRVRKMTGVKSKEMFFWVTISDIFIQDPSSGKIFFGVPGGFKRAFPISAYELEEGKKNSTN